jgi:ferredoxin
MATPVSGRLYLKTYTTSWDITAIADWGRHFEAIRNDSGEGWCERFPKLADILHDRRGEAWIAEAAREAEDRSSSPSRPSTPDEQRPPLRRRTSAGGSWSGQARASGSRQDAAGWAATNAETPIAAPKRKRHRQAQELPLEQRVLLEQAQREHPRRPRMNATKYALLLRTHYPLLGNDALAQAARLPAYSLDRHPAFSDMALSDEQKARLRTAREACPRPPDVSGVAYAQMLHAQDIDLTDAALALASGVTISCIASDTSIHPQSPSDAEQTLLDEAKKACPRTSEMTDAQYARNLQRQKPRLSRAALAKASGVTLGNLGADPQLNPPDLLPDDQARLEEALRKCPRSGVKSNIVYARKLAKQDPLLSNAALAKASGAKIGQIVNDTVINPPALSVEQNALLAEAMQKHPRPKEMKTNLAFARILARHYPHMEDAALAVASGARIDYIAKDSEIHPPALSKEQETLLNAAQRARPPAPAEHESPGICPPPQGGGAAPGLRRPRQGHRRDRQRYSQGSEAQSAEPDARAADLAGRRAARVPAPAWDRRPRLRADALHARSPPDPRCPRQGLRRHGDCHQECDEALDASCVKHVHCHPTATSLGPQRFRSRALATPLFLVQ